MKFSQVIRRGTGLAVAAGIAIATLSTAVPAEAASGYKGKVTANGGVKVRVGPSSHTSSTGTIAKGKTITIDCKVPGTTVSGNRLWYALAGNKGWVSARYIDNIGAAPKKCPSGDTEYGDGRTTATINLRSGPTTADSKRGALKSGTNVTAVCYATGQQIGATKTWYLLTNDSWVSSYYVKRLPTVPSNWPRCAE